MTATVPCPVCASDLDAIGDVELFELTGITSAPTPLSDVRCDLVFTCLQCRTKWTAIVPLEQFLRNPVNPPPRQD